MESKIKKCNYCEDESLTDESGLSIIEFDTLNEVNNRVSRNICLACRRRFKQLTEADIINDIKRNLKTPKEIVDALDKVIIGQDNVKKAIAVEVYDHFQRIINKDLLEEDDFIKKNNILLTGPSGTGKTLIAQTLAEILGVPFAIANATALTESGYVGKDVETILATLLKNSDEDPNKAKYGIVFIDEIDKIAKKGENMSITKDVSGEGVQQALLTIVEGDMVGVPKSGNRIHPKQELTEVDTTDILFICGGAFDGIENIVKSKLKISKSKKTIGFMKEDKCEENEKENELKLAKKIRRSIEIEDLLSYGLIPEFLGRFPNLCNLEPLDEEQLIAVLLSNRGLIKEYQTRFKLQNKKIKFSNEALQEIAKLAIKRRVGARGLRNIMVLFMRDIMFNIPSSKQIDYVIEADDVKEFFDMNKIAV